MMDRFSTRMQEVLAAGGTVVTPNNRMARTLVRAHDAACRAMGAQTWPTAQVLPYHAFIEMLWRQLSIELPLPRLLNAQACRLLWSSVVEQDADAALYATEGAVALAQEAWQLMHTWRASEETQPWRAWKRRGAGMVSADVARFARWAEQYQERLANGGFIDDAGMPDFIAAHAAQLGTLAGALTSPTLLFAGFTELTPQATRLLAALRAAGIHVDEASSLPLAGEQVGTNHLRSYSAANPQEELRAALSWGWWRTQQRIQQREQSPERSNTSLSKISSDDLPIAIVVPALDAQIREVRWLVEDCLPDPALCNVSLGTPLLEKSLVHAALELLMLLDQPLPAGRVAALLQSPYLPGDALTRSRRATLERRWIEGGQRDVGWREVLQGLARTDPALHARWRKADSAASLLPTRAAAGAWPQHLLRWWQALGWPGTQTLSSLDYQVCEAWLHCLDKLPCLEAVAPQLSRRTLQQTLRQWAGETLFQAEGSGAPLQILGTLEAAGLPFEALWVTGLDSTVWPPSAEPHPLLPLSWQRERRMPRATSENTLAYTEQLQTQWCQMAPEVMLSYPRERDGQSNTPAALLATLPAATLAAPLLLSRWQRAQQYSAPIQLECVEDAQAPAVAYAKASETKAEKSGVMVERIRHGSSVLAQQSDCPFKAFASARLRVRSWPQSHEGLSPIERGMLVHAVLQSVWQRWETQAALLALDETTLSHQLDEAYQEVVAAGEAIPVTRWQALPPAVVAMEAVHVQGLLKAWCAIEKTRAPFTVLHREVPLTLELAGMTFSLKADRIDTVEGGVALIDYKTGRPGSLQHWFDERPQSTQLGVYALAWQASAIGEEADMPVRALVYAHLREGMVGVRGIVDEAGDEGNDDDGHLWPRLESVGRFGFGSMQEAQARWRTLFSGLTQAFLAGDARVAPRDAQVCTLCGLQALCRINARSTGVENGVIAVGASEVDDD